MKNLDDLFRLIRDNRCRFLSIDGFYGSGKSTLASLISDEFKLNHIKVDDFIDRRSSRYKVKIKNLVYKLNQSTGFIIDGVCMQDILNQIKLEPELRIYLDVVNEENRYVHSNEYHDYPTYEFALKEIEDNLGVRIPPFNKQVLEYHFRVKPDLSSDYIYIRTERSIA